MGASRVECRMYMGFLRERDISVEFHMWPRSQTPKPLLTLVPCQHSLMEKLEKSATFRRPGPNPGLNIQFALIIVSKKRTMEGMFVECPLYT